MEAQSSTVRVSNLSLNATEQDLLDFFSFSGEIYNIELHREEKFQVANVTFKDPDALDTALLLSGATIVDQPVNIVPVESHDVLDHFQEHDIPQAKSSNTVRVSNLSLKATEQDLLDFFAFSGELYHIELHKEETFQVAHVTFKDPNALDTALLLSGATIVDQPVNIVPVESPDALDHFQEHDIPQTKVGALMQKKENKAQAVITNMLANGYVLGKDAMGKAKGFDEKHRLSATASSKVLAVDKKIGLSQTINAGTTAIGHGLQTANKKFQVTSRTKSALSTVGQQASNAGSTLMKNKYVFSSAVWVSGAYKKVAKAANNVSEKTKEKVQIKEEKRRDMKLQANT